MLRQLTLDHFRNHTQLTCAPAGRTILIEGSNGSGKTSLLEAIYFLGTAKSFRSHRMQHWIQNGADLCRVTGEVLEGDMPMRLGIERSQRGEVRMRIDGQDVRSAAQLAHALPLQLIHSDTFGLLTEGPSARRQLMDWGVFHTEPQFFEHWRCFQRALKQRNAALKIGMSDNAIFAWDHELVAHAETISELRREYVDALSVVVQSLCAQLLPNKNISLRYLRGWDESMQLGTLLSAHIHRDRELKYTYSGPQRADLRIKADDMPGEEALSRGQQKLLVYALSIAQSLLLTERTGRRAIYLIDDLPAEFDPDNLRRVVCLLNTLQTQVFITGVQLDMAAELCNKENLCRIHFK